MKPNAVVVKTPLKIEIHIWQWITSCRWFVVLELHIYAAEEIEAMDRKVPDVKWSNTRNSRVLDYMIESYTVHGCVEDFS
jgi:hypothetical protein